MSIYLSVRLGDVNMRLGLLPCYYSNISRFLHLLSLYKKFNYTLLLISLFKKQICKFENPTNIDVIIYGGYADNNKDNKIQMIAGFLG